MVIARPIGSSLPIRTMPIEGPRSRSLASRLPAGVRVQHLAFAGVVSAVALIRWRLLRDTPYPTGLDGGNWLAFGHAIFGEHLRSSSLVYPPVVPVIAVASERLLGTYGGIQALAFAAGAAPAIGSYALLYAWGLRWRAVALAGFLAASAGTGEAMAWGGYPQLIGLGILPLFILALDRFIASDSIRGAFAPALLLLAALATSDLVGPFSALVGLIYLVTRFGLLLRMGKGNSPRHIAFGVGLSVTLALTMAPVYLELVPGIATNGRAQLTAHASAQSALDAFSAATQDLPTVWLVALAVAFAAPLLILVRNDRLPLLSAAILIPSAALLALVSEYRIVYFVPLGIVVGLGAWSEMLGKLPEWGRRSLDTAVITCLVVDVVVGTQYYAIQRDYYKVLDPGVVLSLARLDTISGPQQLIAVSPAPGDWELGWWVEGAAHRRSIYAGNPVWLNYPDEKARNAIANRIFAAQNGVEQSRQEARLAGAAYLFVDKEWSGYQNWVGNGLSVDPGAIVYQNESVLIVATGV